MSFTICRPNIKTKMSQKSWCIWNNIYTKYIKCLELYFGTVYYMKIHMVYDTQFITHYVVWY